MPTWLSGVGSRGHLGLDAGHAARLPGYGLACAAAPAQAVGLVAVAVELAGRLLLLALAAHLRSEFASHSVRDKTTHAQDGQFARHHRRRRLLESARAGRRACCSRVGTR